MRGLPLATPPTPSPRVCGLGLVWPGGQSMTPPILLHGHYGRYWARNPQFVAARFQLEPEIPEKPEFPIAGLNVIKFPS